MKKHYIIPETQVIQMDTRQPMLAASLGVYDEETGTQFSREEESLLFGDSDILDLLLK